MSSEINSSKSVLVSDLSNSLDSVDCYDYDLPEELIATEPLSERDASRLLVMTRSSNKIQHCTVTDLPELLGPGDCVVLNDTKVLPARLLGTRASTGGKWEGLYLGQSEAGDWRLIGQTRGYVQVGERVAVRPLRASQSREAGRSAGSAELSLTLVGREEDGVWLMRPEQSGDAFDLLSGFGTMPLPPYMHRKIASESDWERYQTTYAKQLGSVAAPTAGLHLTEALLSRIRDRGIEIATVTLHVGLGTFRPIGVSRLSEHPMHSEWGEVPGQAVETILETKRRGGRVVAIGTTSVRTLESAAAATGSIQPWRGATSLFIRPPYQFRCVDVLFTNFHLPRSTLIVLVSTFAGLELVRTSYQEAIRERYRFYSYGDAMLILP